MLWAFPLWEMEDEMIQVDGKRERGRRKHKRK